MRRALPTLLAWIVVLGLLAAAVVTSSTGESEQSADRKAGGALSLMAKPPSDLEPQLEDFEPPPTTPARRKPPDPPRFASVDDLAERPKARPSVPVGKPWKGRLRSGVQFPEKGAAFFTFDSARRTSPSDWWRRWGTDLTVGRTLAVLKAFRAAHPGVQPVGVGDLSLPRGGPFGREYGGLGHKSHQNGVDVDVYYPRRDRRLEPPRKPSEVDRALSQDLVNRFVAAGAVYVFVGPRVGLSGPRGTVQELVNHDDHLHVRWPAG